MNKVKWGIIGCGDVCEVKSGPAFSKIKNSSLVAVMRRDAKKAEDFATRHQVAKFYTNADDLINDPTVNAIYVATPPSTHKEYAIKAMKAGKPVYVEKPMGLNFAECLEIIQVAKQTNQKIFVAFYRRALPYFLKIKEIIDSNVLGNLISVDMKYYCTPKSSDLDPSEHSWRITKQISGGGYFHDMAPHMLDIVDFLLGEISTVKGYASNLGGIYDVEDTISAIFRFKSGMLGTGQWCFVTDEKAKQDYIRIIGTTGYVEFSTFSFSPIIVETETLNETYTFEQPEHIQQPLIQNIVDELRDWGTSPSTMSSAARTSRIMDIIMNIETR